MSTMTSEREAFEAWARSKGFSLMKHATGEYVESYTRHVWDAFRAGTSTHLAKPAQAVDALLDCALDAAAFLNAIGRYDRAQTLRDAVRAIWPESAESMEARPLSDGWRFVPVTPTPEMIAACIAVWQERLRRKAENGTLLCGGNAEKSFRENWAAMLSASPTPDKEG
jgi:hypothetical protein